MAWGAAGGIVNRVAVRHDSMAAWQHGVGVATRATGPICATAAPPRCMVRLRGAGARDGAGCGQSGAEAGGASACEAGADGAGVAARGGSSAWAGAQVARDWEGEVEADLALERELEAAAAAGSADSDVVRREADGAAAEGEYDGVAHAPCAHFAGAAAAAAEAAARAARVARAAAAAVQAAAAAVDRAAVSATAAEECRFEQVTHATRERVAARRAWIADEHGRLCSDFDGEARRAEAAADVASTAAGEAARALTAARARARKVAADGAVRVRGAAAESARARRAAGQEQSITAQEAAAEVEEAAAAAEAEVSQDAAAMAPSSAGATLASGARATTAEAAEEHGGTAAQASAAPAGSGAAAGAAAALRAAHQSDDELADGNAAAGAAEEASDGGEEEPQRATGMSRDEIAADAAQDLEQLRRGDAIDDAHAAIRARALAAAAAPLVSVHGCTPSPTAAEAAEACAPKTSECTVRVAHWNTRGLHVRLGQPAEPRKRRQPTQQQQRLTQGASAALDKAAWLEGQLAASPADVMFLYEVAGFISAWQPLCSWLRQRGYEGRFISERGGKGVVVAARRGTATLRDVTRLAPRVVGVEVQFSADRRRRRLVGMHGFNSETTAADIDVNGQPSADCFAGQQAAAQKFLEDGGGGLAGGDMNRVLCAAWRAGTHDISDDDQRLRDWAGWRCACCGDAATDGGGACSAVPGCCRPTRWATSRGSVGDATAQIDFAIAFGAERGRWQARNCGATVLPGLRDGLGGAVSDHAYMEYIRRVAQPLTDRRRELPLAVGSRTGEAKVREAYVRRTRGLGEAFGRELEHAARGASASFGAATEAVCAALVREGKAAAAEVQEARAEAAKSSRGATPKQRFGAWAKWLRVMLDLRSDGEHPRGRWSELTLRHSKRLSAMAARQSSAGDAFQAWAPLLTCARRELRRAGRDERAAAQSEDARLYAAVTELSGAQEDALTRMQRAWRALRASRASTAVDKVFKDDKAPGPNDAPGSARVIHYDEEEFKAELRRIGELFVKKMADAPACLPAFRAWCGVFMEEYDTLRGSDGGDFVLAKELTWDVFKEVLASMPNNKAVGAGGFSVELLRAAGEEAQIAFYEALIGDLRRRRLPGNWHTVLYALLLKKNANPDVIAERREIALMAQDMKLLLQMVRRVSYQRLVGRVACAQAGWLSGYGCADTGAIAARIIQQQARLKQPLYLLYVDLATFFPRCDRRVVEVAEALHGLPREVRELAAMIYGSAAEPELAVTCHYDSAAGLGHGFKNYMGCLMGCVLSPDKAKILLNTVIVAIEAVCKGVRLWGYGEQQTESTWRRIMHAAFADDWVGTYSSVHDLRRAWSIWRVWEAVSGSKLGVKARAKTVVSGVTYDAAGKVVSMADPLLQLRGGGFVPFAHHDEEYKHVGNARQADGDDGAAWRLFLMKIQAALARLRQMRRPSRNEFISVSNALIGGLAGYYLQTLYITWEQAEEIERKWRSIFRLKFGGTGEEDTSKPRALFYQPQGRGRQPRQHVWAAGLAAIAACTNAGMADVADTPQRAAARSQVALAMERWGCRADPRTWSWGHLVEALESSLRTAKCKQLGDAWMLATALLEDEEDTQYAEADGTRSPWTRHFAQERAERWGRWRGELAAGDPLHVAAAHWARPESTMISEPVAAGGLGLTPEPLLLHAGIVSVGHMCHAVVAPDGSRAYAWLSHDAAVRSMPRLPRHGAAAAAWKRQLAQLREAGVEPCRDRAVPPGGADRRAAIGRATAEAEAADATRVERLLEVLDNTEVCERRSQAVWARELARCFPGVLPRAATEWAVGGCDRGREARGARYVFAMGGDGSFETRGGQARWMRRQQHGASGVDGDASGLLVGDDGWLVGHEARTEELLQMLRFDAGGAAVNAAGAPIDVAAAAELPPALQIQARAAMALLAAKSEVIDQWPTAKAVQKAERRSNAGKTQAETSGQSGDATSAAAGKPPQRRGPHINLAVQRRNRWELAKWQARIGATAVYTLDGTRTVVGEKGDREHVVARAAVRHDGQVFGGRLHEPEGANNYLAELAAQLDAAAAEDVGGRIIVVFDATGPPVAMRRLMRAANRRRQGKYVGPWLDALLRLLDRQEVVVLLWQTSHVGSPVNEWADKAADAAAEGAVVAVPRLPDAFASLTYTRPKRSTHAWAAPLAAGVALRRLKGALQSTQMHEPTDVPPLTLPDDVQRTCDAVLAQRCQFGDARRFVGRLRKAAGGLRVCPFGCTDSDGQEAEFSWEHVQFRCQICEVVTARQAWATQLRQAAEVVQKASQLPHSQLLEATRLAESGLPRTRSGAAAGAPAALRPAQAVYVRRLVGGLVGSSGEVTADKDKALRRQLTTTVVAGARVQQAALALVQIREREIADRMRELQIARKAGRKWRLAVSAGGPARAAELRAVYVSATRVAFRVLTARDGFRQDAPWTRGWAIAERPRPHERWEDALQQCVASAAAEARRRLRRPGNMPLHTRGDSSTGAGDAPDRPGGSAFAQWRMLSLALRWRLRAAMRYRRWQEVEPDAVYCTDLCWEDVEARRMAVIVMGEECRGAPLMRESFYVRAAQVRGVGGFETSLIDREETASRHYLNGGGRNGDRRRATELARREVAWQARRLQRYRLQLSGPTLPGELGRGVAVAGLSGRALSPQGPGFHVEIAPRGKRVARRGVQAPRAAAAPGAETDDGSGRLWPLERVLEVRRSQTREAVTLARIRWLGINALTGLPWRDSWLDVTARRMCNPAARSEVDAMLLTKYGEPPQRTRPKARAFDAADAPRSKKPRTAAQEAAQAGWRNRWSVLRGRDAGSAQIADEDAVVDSTTRGKLERRKRRIAEVGDA